VENGCGSKKSLTAEKYRAGGDNMSKMQISDAVKYVGVEDTTLDCFESQYPVPNGVTYNSYVILDEKVAVMDTVDARATDAWLANVEEALSGRKVDYLVVLHMEPDHAANVAKFAELHPEAQIVGNAKTFQMIGQFFEMDLTGRQVLVKEGDSLSLGEHTLTFVMAPMVHWPEVMVAYESKEKILFSADAFGRFGTLDYAGAWVDEGARYYLNIVGKYGAQVQALLKKAKALDIQTICPLHGPALKENLGYYLDLYQTWSTYQPEKHGVLVAYASIHGNTAAAAKKFGEILAEQGEEVDVVDLSRVDVSDAVRKAFYYDRIVLACATYDGGLFPSMEEFLNHLKTKNFQNRKFALMENGSWAPMAAKLMRGVVETMKNVEIIEPVVTIKSAMKAQTVETMKELAAALK
jgi:flavorubredoxin